MQPTSTLKKPPCKKRHSFFECSLCLFRACLGKMIVYIYKWRKKWRFSHRNGERTVHMALVNALRPIVLPSGSPLSRACLGKRTPYVKSGQKVPFSHLRPIVALGIAVLRPVLPHQMSHAGGVVIRRIVVSIRKHVSLLRFPCVCPEPVLVK